MIKCQVLTRLVRILSRAVCQKQLSYTDYAAITVRHLTVSSGNLGFSQAQNPE